MSKNHQFVVRDYHISNCSNGTKLSETNGNISLSPTNPRSHTLWHFRPIEGNYIIELRNTHWCLDVQGNRRDQGVPVCLWDYHGGQNQQWIILETDKVDHYHIQSRLSGFYLGYENGTICQTAFSNGTHMLWYIIPAPIVEGFDWQPNTPFTITSVLDGGKLTSQSGKAVIVGPTNQTEWYFHQTHGNSYYIYHVGADQMLDVTGEKKDQGIELGTFATKSGKHQQFAVITTDAASNEYFIKALHSDRFVTNEKGVARQYDLNGQSSQKWIIERV